MLNYVFTALAGVIAGFVLSKIFKIIQMSAYHKDVVDAVVRSMTLEEESAEALGKASMIDYVVETKGLEYAILYYGSIYHLLQGVSKKDAQTQKLEEALSRFLHEALKEDIDKYRKDKAAMGTVKSDGKKKIG